MQISTLLEDFNDLQLGLGGVSGGPGPDHSPDIASWARKPSGAGEGATATATGTATGISRASRLGILKLNFGLSIGGAIVTIGTSKMN
ncbi:hypothetical protein VN97_g2923 [Penicillium thymicola]|uniref:Uncharacterized protein n=1 Tax=Penicillium thymicola TaxID=293382 RepID=A0AAI9XBS5_PENTH|nr:hypothetical protein VN97_g2923 [Penicillium thymicola]